LRFLLSLAPLPATAVSMVILTVVNVALGA
jgi:hypothetical protein